MCIVLLMMDLVEAFVEEGKVQQAVGPVEHKVLEHDTEIHLPQELESCEPYTDGAEARSVRHLTQ